MGRIYGETGAAYAALGTLETAVTYQKKALRIAIKYDNLDYLIPMTRNVCMTLVRLDRIQEAVQLIEDAGKRISGHHIRLSDNLQAALLSTQIMAYTASNQYARAGFHAREFVNLLEKHSADDHIYVFTPSLVFFFVKTHKGKEAEAYADSLLRYAGEAKSKQGFSISYFAKSQADSAIGDLRGALQYYQRYKKITDSL